MGDEGDAVDIEKRSHFTRNFLSDATNFIDNHIQAIRTAVVLQYTSYGLAAVGVVVILRSTHAFKVFNKVKDIPVQYIASGVKLQGQIALVTSTGGLRVKNIPVFKLPWKKDSQAHLLPITLGGVEVLPPGVDWLEETLLNQQIWFEPLKVQEVNNEENLCCIVTKKKYFRNICINEEIVGLGLGKVQHEEGLSGKTYNKLSISLLKAEIKADKKGKGVWKRPPVSERIKAYPAQIIANISKYFTDIFKWKKQNIDSQSKET